MMTSSSAKSLQHLLQQGQLQFCGGYSMSGRFEEDPPKKGSSSQKKKKSKKSKKKEEGQAEEERLLSEETKDDLDAGLIPLAGELLAFIACCNFVFTILLTLKLSGVVT